MLLHSVGVLQGLTGSLAASRAGKVLVIRHSGILAFSSMCREVFDFCSPGSLKPGGVGVQGKLSLIPLLK